MTTATARRTINRLGPILTGQTAPTLGDVALGLQSIEIGDPRLTERQIENLANAVETLLETA